MGLWSPKWGQFRKRPWEELARALVCGASGVTGNRRVMSQEICWWELPIAGFTSNPFSLHWTGPYPTSSQVQSLCIVRLSPCIQSRSLYRVFTPTEWPRLMTLHLNLLLTLFFWHVFMVSTGLLILDILLKMSSIDINATLIIFTDESSSSCRLYLGGTPNIYGRRDCVWHGQCPVSWTAPNNVHTWFSGFCPEFMWDISLSVREGWHVRVREAKDRCSDSTKSRKVTPSHLFALPPRQIHPPPFLLSVSLERSCLFLFTELLWPLCLCWREKKCVEMEEFLTLSNFPSGQTRFWF